jgi:hypothetical protein
MLSVGWSGACGRSEGVEASLLAPQSFICEYQPRLKSNQWGFSDSIKRYKTVSLKTTDISAARERAFDQDADVRFRIKHDVPVFNRPFRDVAHEYLLSRKRGRSAERSAPHGLRNSAPSSRAL